MRDEVQIDPLRLWNALLAALVEGVPLAGRGRVRLVALQASDAPTGPLFRLDSEEGLIFAEARDLPLSALTRSGLDMAALDRLPPALAGAILQHAVDLLLQQAGPAARGRLRGLRPCDPAEMRGAERLLLLLDGIAPQTAEIRLQADRAVLTRLLLDLMPPAPRGWMPDPVAARLTFPCSFRMAGRDLALSRLRALAPGDLVLLGRAAPRFHAHHLTLALHHDGTRWTIGDPTMNDDFPSAEATASAAELPAANPGAIPVRLSFVLSEHSLTLAELQALVPGAYLPFDPEPAAPGHPVAILANGRRIGDGHVVDVDGQPAIRIARLFGG